GDQIAPRPRSGAPCAATTFTGCHQWFGRVRGDAKQQSEADKVARFRQWDRGAVVRVCGVKVSRLTQPCDKRTYFAQYVGLVRKEDVVMRAREPYYMRAGHAILKCFRLLLH